MTTNSNIDSINNFETYVNSTYYTSAPTESGTPISTSLYNSLESSFSQYYNSNVSVSYTSHGANFGSANPLSAIVSSTTTSANINATYNDQPFFQNAGGDAAILLGNPALAQYMNNVWTNSYANFINYINNKTTFTNYPSNYTTAQGYFLTLINTLRGASGPETPISATTLEQVTSSVSAFNTWVASGGMGTGNVTFALQSSGGPSASSTFASFFSSFLLNYSGSTTDITPTSFLTAYYNYATSGQFLNQQLTGTVTVPNTGTFPPTGPSIPFPLFITISASPTQWVNAQNSNFGTVGVSFGRNSPSLGENVPLTPTGTLPSVTSGMPSSVIQGYLTQFYNSYTASFGPEATSNPNLGTAGDPNNSTSNPGSGLLSVANFNSTFTQFITYYLNNRNLTGLTLNGANNTKSISQDFFNQWQTFLTSTSLMQSAQGSATGANSTNPLASINQYQTMYSSFFPAGTTQPGGGFLTDLNSFIQTQLGGTSASTPATADNYFVTSQAVNAYFQHLLKEYQNINGTGTGKITLDGANFDAVKILFNIFNLLVQLIQDLQNLTVSEAKYLQFLANYQKAYTQTMAQIPVFSPNTPQLVGTDAYTTRVVQDLATLNSSITSNLQSYRDIESSRAQQVQSQLTQGNQNVNQQANIATQIMQEFSTILQAIHP